MSKINNFFKKSLYCVKIAVRWVGNILKEVALYLKKKQLLIPLLMLFVLVIFNVCINTSFFNIRIGKNNNDNIIMQGTIINILNNGSEIAILAIGMTFITAACGGQDISVGATTTIAGSVIMVMSLPERVGLPIIVAFLVTCIVSVAFAMFNGVLVSRLKILPMVATLILFTSGRNISLWIAGGSSLSTTSSLSSRARIFEYFGTVIPGFPIPMPIIITIICIVIISLVLKFTNLGLYTQSVGINAKSSKLNGINPERTKMMAFIIMGLCVAIVGFIASSRERGVNHKYLNIDMELDTILAVAIGGTMLSGGKFNLAGSIMGAYIIKLLTLALNTLGVPPPNVKVVKAIFVIALVILGSPMIREKLSALLAKLNKSTKKRGNGNIQKEGA